MVTIKNRNKIMSDPLELTIPAAILDGSRCLKRSNAGDVSRSYNITLKSPRNENLFIDNEEDLRDLLQEYLNYRKRQKEIEEKLRKQRAGNREDSDQPENKKLTRKTTKITRIQYYRTPDDSENSVDNTINNEEACCSLKFVRIMELKLCVLFVLCVSGYPLQVSDKETNKNYKKPAPTISNIKSLEREIWKATVNGDLTKAVRLESRLEGDVLKAALGALLQSRKNPGRSKRDLRELGYIVRRDKRTVKMLSSVVKSAGAQTGIERSLPRIPRQNMKYNASEDLNNDIIPPSTTEEPEMIAMNTTMKQMSAAIISTIADSITTGTDIETITTPTMARQEEEENPDEDDGGGGGLGGLITSFLGSLSTPEGGVDLDAVTGLLGGLSTQNDNGTFDFTGLQDTVGSLFGGGDEEGGSNVGLFLGGLLGAVIGGSAGDAGAKGAGKLVGNILSGILPGISRYPTPEDGPNGEPGIPRQGLDSGGFFAGVLKSVFGGSSGGGNGTMMGGGMSKILQIKYKIFTSVFSIITKLLGASASGSSSGAGAKKW
ncbi:hypothetical protein CBL_01919 [Carabus blaptoides fortunei]